MKVPHADGQDDYVDCHAWQFTPAAFKLIMLELRQLGLTDWNIRNLFGPNGCEFLVILEKGAERIGDPAQFQHRRMALLLEQLAEYREQTEFAFGDPTSAVVRTLVDQVSQQEARVLELERQLAEVQHVLGRVLRWVQPMRKLLHPFRSAG